MSAGPNSPPFLENATQPFSAPHGGVFLLEVRPSLPSSATRFRFEVYEINPAPELRSPRFTLGDTVRGETIDPSVDLDEFVARGDSGQEIVAVVETQGPAGSGSVALDVVDSVANSFLGYVFADAADSNPRTTGRMRLTGTHDYPFTLSSVMSNRYPRYRGPYRFWTYVINRGPEHRTAPIPFNTEIANERIDRAGDVDEFTFQATAGHDYKAFVQGAGRSVQLEVAPQGGPALAIATSQPSDTALFAHATNRFQIASAGTYVVRLTGTAPSWVADTGAYRFFLYAIDRRPEHVPATIAPGDTVTGEDIGLPGDIDEFTFEGAAGEEFNAFLQARNGSPDAELQLEVLSGGGTVLRTAESVGTDSSLLRQPTGRFALPATGTYRLRVSAPQSYGVADYRGPYRLFLYRVNRHPETLPDTLAFGDSLSGEAMDVPGDVDEFRVHVPDSSGANLLYQLESQPTGGSLTVQLIDSASGRVIVSGTAYSTARQQTGRVLLAPGTYILRADGNPYEDRSIIQGRYRIWLYRFSFGPESIRDTFAIGDTVSGEVIEPLGDIDVFHFHGLRGQHVNIALQGLGAPSAGGFQAFISGPTGYSIVFSGTSAAALHDHQTLRVDLPSTGWYEIDVSGAGWAPFDERGAYRLAVEPLGSAPERVSGALVPGDSVTTEAIDSPGDWDEYTVTATPGQDLGVIVRSTRTDLLYPLLRVFDRTTGDSLAGTVVYGEHLTGPFRVPASGQVGIAVYQPDGFFRFCSDATCGDYYRFVGEYAFRIIPINRAPENVPATYTVGDTVRGEAVFPGGDIDEFTSSATPGDTLSPWYRLTAGPVPPGGSGITLEVIDPATGSVLVGRGASLVGSIPQYWSPGSFAVPAGGSFLIRVRGSGTFGDELTTAPYEFFVRRGP